MTEYQKAVESADYIKTRVADLPEVAVVLGSGIGALADEVKSATVINYGDIPFYPQTSVPGHKGSLVFGKLGCADGDGRRDVNVLLASGRVHLYEGFDPSEVSFYVKVFKILGIKTLILTNAAGGLNLDFSAGDIMLIKDHIGLFAPSPLAGQNEDEFGVRFPDMSSVYDKDLSDIARSSAKKENIDLKRGVYTYAKGPMFETPSEIKALKALGTDAVGMSTVPEAVVANYCGIKVLGLSLITNMAAGMLDQPLTHEEVMETGREAGDKFRRLVKNIIYQL